MTGAKNRGQRARVLTRSGSRDALRHGAIQTWLAFDESEGKRRIIAVDFPASRTGMS